MAAATIANTKFHAAGDMLFVTADLTAVADTNTWVVPGITEIDNIIVTTKTSGTPAYGGVAWSLNTVTFDMSGTADLTVTAIGR
jgi:hypothetical protein